MKKLFQIAVVILMTSLMMWCAGLLWFAGLATTTPQSTTEIPRADAIVVLTGGKGRIEEGFYLFATKRAPNFFISGVNKDVTLDMLKNRWDGVPLPECCVDLGYTATNTWSNALETERWMKNKDINSIFLVTSDYHMPRARLEFSFAAPNTTVHPHPVYSEEGDRTKMEFVKLLVGEYHKTVLTYFRNFFTNAQS